MADPTVTLPASGTSTSATTTVSFTAQPAGTLLVLCVIADDYRTATGSGRPESTGFVLPTGASEQNNTGGYLWYKLATGSETSVQYTIGSAAHSAYVLLAASNIDQTTPFDIAAANFKNSFQADWTTPAAVATAGRRFAVGMIGASTNIAGGPTGVSGWTNGYVEVGDANGQAGPQMECAAGALTYTADGTASTSTTGTFDTNGPGNIGGVTAVFRVASGGTNYAATPSDAEGIADSAAQQTAAARAPTDPEGITDAAASQVDAVRTAADPVGLTDSATGVLSGSLTVQVDDAVGISDTGAPMVVDRDVSLADVEGTTDATALGVARGITDQASAAVDSARMPADALGITDSATGVITGAGAGAAADPIGILDAAISVLNGVRTVDDLLGLIDAATTAVDRPRGSDDQVGIVDNVSAALTTAGDAHVDDHVGADDAAAAAQMLTRTAADPLGLSDAAVAVLTTAVDYLATITDSVGISDTAGSGGQQPIPVIVTGMDRPTTTVTGTDQPTVTITST